MLTPNDTPQFSSPNSVGCGRNWWIGWFVLVVGFAIVRLPGLLTDLWLDEIWSLRMVQSIHTPWEIFSKLQHDNNHPLNSWYLYLVQPASADWVYRLLSWLAGSLTVGLGALIAREQSRRWHGDESEARANLAGWLAGVVFGGASLLIYYASEARGYAPAVAMGLLAFYAYGRHEQTRSISWAILYSVAVILGLLAHLAVVQVMLSLAGLGLIQLYQNRASWRSRLLGLAGFHLPSWLFFAAYYFGFVRKMQIGGGPENPLLGVLGETAAYVLGIPLSQGLIALFVCLGLILGGLFLIWRSDRVSVLFYALVIGVTPLVGMLASKFTLLFPRYFIVSAAFALLVLAYGLSRLWWQGRWGRVVSIGLMIMFLVGNGRHVAQLLEAGRGHYREALSTLAARTPFDDVTLSSDHDFRNYALVEYYREISAPDKRVIYYPADRVPPIGTQWRILHRIGEGEPFPESVIDSRGNFYLRERLYPYVGLSGWSWAVYRNMRMDPLD